MRGPTFLSSSPVVTDLLASVNPNGPEAPPRRPALHHGADAVHGEARGGLRPEQGQVADAGGV